MTGSITFSDVLWFAFAAIVLSAFSLFLFRQLLHSL